MGLFSKKKTESIGEFNSDSGEIPANLPFTVIDKLSSESSPGASTAHSSQNAIYESVNKQAPKVKGFSSDDLRKIPPEIAREQTSSRASRPSQEVKYVNIGIPQGYYNKESVSEENLFRPRENRQNNKISSSLDSKHSFFSSLEKHILHEKSLGHKQIDSRYLINKMKEFHESVKTGHGFFLHEQDAEKQISRKIEELKELESDWLYRRKELDAAELFLAEKELEIETKFEELRKLMVSADKNTLFNRKCSDGKVFVLHNGGVLHSVQELLYSLPKMGDDVFFFHVNAGKNDFSAWIKHVLGSEELSNAILSSNSRQDMINRLKNF